MADEPMNIVFRTDASLNIGSGHVMRCLTLADELRQRGCFNTFICREHSGNLIALIRQKGYNVATLPKKSENFISSPDGVAHSAWLEAPWKQDAIDTITALEGNTPAWLIVDHYALDHRWEERLRPHVDRIMVIDDLADRPHDCDLLLDQNLYPDMVTRYKNLVPDECRILIGPGHALLRPEFATARKSLRKRDGTIQRILVFFGGTDPSNETEKTLKALSSVTDRCFSVDVVVGGGNINKEQIRDYCSASNGFSFHCQVDNMAELMAEADLAIGAGGTTTWERCAVGLPSLVIAVADNQIGIGRSADKAGAVCYLGEAENITEQELLRSIHAISADQNNIRHMTQLAMQLVDVKGTERVAEYMVKR